MSILFTNNAATTLASSISNSATSLTVASGQGALFPTLSGSDIFYATLANGSGGVEIVKVTARSTDTFTIVRGQDGTSAVSWNTGDKVELRVTAADLGAMVQSANLQVGGTATTGTASSSNYLRGDGAWTTPVTSNVAGTGINVSGATGAVTISNSGVTSNVAGTGISVSGATGAVTVTNTGVTSAVAGTGISVSGSTGAVTISKNSPVDVQTFNSTGTWTKPSGGQTMALIQVWGGGGGAARSNGNKFSTGGGGGAYNEIQIPLAYLSSTVTATVGGGGAAATVTNTAAAVGGNSSFAFAATWLGQNSITAYGGGGANTAYAAGGGGGGQLSAGTTQTSNASAALPGQPYFIFTGTSNDFTVPLTNNHQYFQGHGAISYISCGLSPMAATCALPWGGGGGGAGSESGARSCTAGGNALWGGAGGNGGGDQAYTGAKSVYGGNGGTGGGAGIQPGGGGSGHPTANVTGGAGAAGRIVITCW